MKRRGSTCQYGIGEHRCGHVAYTKRPRPGGPNGTPWDVCDQHAVILDRIRANVFEHRELLTRLAKAD